MEVKSKKKTETSLTKPNNPSPLIKKQNKQCHSVKEVLKKLIKMALRERRWSYHLWSIRWVTCRKLFWNSNPQRSKEKQINLIDNPTIEQGITLIQSHIIWIHKNEEIEKNVKWLMKSKNYNFDIEIKINIDYWTFQKMIFK